MFLVRKVVGNGVGMFMRVIFWMCYCKKNGDELNGFRVYKGILILIVMDIKKF